MQQPLPSERLVLVDALRGFALMGLFLVHMVEYFELYWYKPEPGWVHNVMFFLFGGKAFAIFALLFGTSFYIVLDRYRLKGGDYRARFLWRLILLFGFGYLHSLFYAGDILQVLAFAGIVLLLADALPTRLQWLVAAFLIVKGPSLFLAGYAYYNSEYASQQPDFIALMGRNFEVFAHGSFTELLSYNLLQGQVGKWYFFVESGRLWYLLGLVLMGNLLARAGFFHQVTRYLSLCKRTLCLAVALGIVLYLIQIFITPQLPESMVRWHFGQTVSGWLNLCLTAIWVTALILVHQKKTGERLLGFFSPAGRMSLTLYVAQGLIFTPLFYGYGLAWYDSLGQLPSLLWGLLFGFAQLVLAYLWLRRYYYGPLEWLWRVATFFNTAVPWRKANHI